jgi:hypothetical protein
MGVPSLDVLTSTGARPLGWMAMYVVTVSQKFDSYFDIGFLAAGEVEWLDRT